MTVTINKPVYLAPGQYLVEWTTDLGAGTTFWIYLDGVLVESDTSTTSMVIALETGSASEVEVLDALPLVTDPMYPRRARIAWYGVAGAVKYKVEEYVSSVWTERKTFRSEGAEFFAYQSRVLEDSTTHQFRVTPIGADTNEGTPLTYSVLMVRRPDPPSVTYTYAAGDQKVTIASA